MTRRIDKPDTPVDAQIRGILDSPERKCFIMTAGAGSGKTTSLVKALDYVNRKNGQEFRRRDQRIVCITYTDIAVKEISGDLGDQPIFHISTIHSFLWDLISPFHKDIRDWVKRRIEEKIQKTLDERAAFGPRVHQKTRDNNQREEVKLKEQLPAIDNVPRFTYLKGNDYAKGILGHEDIIKLGPYLIQQKPLLAKILARKYPVFFIDESQDTVPEVVYALKHVALSNQGHFQLGFFGDPMQKIYTQGIGSISALEGWASLQKPENFRCPTDVLSVVNKIRSMDDGLQQECKRVHSIDGVTKPVKGSAVIFVLPADDNRSLNLNRVRNWLSVSYSDAGWISDNRDADVRILVIAHRMAAKRLGFNALYSAFNDATSDSIKDAFAEGTSWPLAPFVDVIIPVYHAIQEKRDFEVMNLLRQSSPLFHEDNLRSQKNWPQVLAKLKRDILELNSLIEGTETIKAALKFAEEKKIIILDERMRPLLDGEASASPPLPSAPPASVIDSDPIHEKMRQILPKYLACPAKETLGYYRYINDQSVYATHQGVKGAEFDRVLVVLDDTEGQHRQFSYEKLLGIRPLSDTDNENLATEKESILERTRRLFYVCCSRATKDLVVVIYTENVAGSVTLLNASGIFPPESIYTIEDLPGS